MAIRSKPNMEEVWADTGAKIDPNTQYANPNKIKTGWLAEIPLHESENFMRNRADQMLAHLNDYGIALWDNVTNFPLGAWSRSTVDGEVYESIQVVPTGLADPSALPAYWKLYSDNFVPITGNTGNPMTGNLVLDTAFKIVNNTSLVLESLGGAISLLSSNGNINFNNNYLKNVADPLSPLDGVNLQSLGMQPFASIVFNTLGGFLTILNSFNIDLGSTIRNNTGSITAHFTDNPPDADYCLSFITEDGSSGGSRIVNVDYNDVLVGSATIICRTSSSSATEFGRTSVIFYKKVG